MAAYRISYYLYRSNPIIWREIKIPSECTVQDLIATFCLAMGISPVPGKISDEEEQLIAENTVLKDIFETEDFFRLTTGRCEIFQEEKRQEMNSLTFFYEIMEKLEENLSAPEIVDGTLFHLPQNVFRVGIINEILNGLENEESYTLPAIGPFYQGQQYFNKKKTQNLIYSCFLPKKAAMLRTEYAVPLLTVLEKKTLHELKSLASSHCVYVNNHRKVDYIAALDKNLSERDPYYILRKMRIQEYENFRKLVLKGEIEDRGTKELYEIFPVLFYYGVISFSKKQDVFISSAIMQEYEDWYDLEEEIQFRKEKLLSSVMIGCGIYYGVITKKTCRTVLNTLYPDEIPEEMLDQMWEKEMRSLNLPDISFTQNEESEDLIAYDRTLFGRKEEPLYLKVLSEEYTPRFIPDKRIFETVIQNGLQSEIHAYEELLLFIRPYSYGEYERDFWSMNAVNCLRKGYSVSETSKLIIQRFHYIWHDKKVVQKNLKEILNKILPDVPNILFYGYTANAAMEQNIEPKALTEMKHLIKEIQAEDNARKEAAARKRTAAKKAGTTGKKGRRS